MTMQCKYIEKHLLNTVSNRRDRLECEKGNVAACSGDRISDNNNQLTQQSQNSHHQHNHHNSEFSNDLDEREREPLQYNNKNRFPLLPEQQQHFQQQLEPRLIQNFDGQKSSNNPPEYKYEPTGVKPSHIASILQPTSIQSQAQQSSLTGGNSSGQILESHLKVDQWLLNQFKIATEAALDLRSTPVLSHLQHHIHQNQHQGDTQLLLEQQDNRSLNGRTENLGTPTSQSQQTNPSNISVESAETKTAESQMTTEVQLQLQHLTNNRSLFKMETDFWQQTRGPPIGLASVSHHHPHHQHQQHVHHQNHQSMSLFNAIGNNASTDTNNTTGAATNNMPSNADSLEANSTPKSVAVSENATSAIVRSGDSICGHPRSPLQNTSNSDQNNLQSANSPTPTSAHIHHQLQHQINHHIQQQQQADTSQIEPNGAETAVSGASNLTTAVPMGHQMTQNQLQQMQQIQQQQSIIQQQQQQQHQHSQTQQQQQISPQLNVSQQQANITATSLTHPQQALSPSGGSSTPDMKFNSEKLVSEIQLFMHKSAMQQIQQIPRVGLGPGGMGADSKPHQCQQCLKSFSSNHQLVQHIRVHTGEKPYKCSYCDRRFKQLSHVQQHTRLHTGERPYKCHLPDCGRAFIQLSNLQQHLRNHDAQVERAKNRPFHCNICGKGFATESSLRTHTSKELQLHLGVLQQHAALIGGPNATSCPICHKLFLGGEALMEHMKHAHKDPHASSVATSFSTDFQFKNELINPSNSSPPPSQQQNLASHQTTSNVKTCSFSVKKTYPFAENLGSTCLQSNDPYLAKRRTANHPCPVCGKHYVNEGSLRKHLACHPETSQLTSSLRMWPCSVCQAVFTHENGLLTHMEHMRMDPKHQFAAQYVLSRAAAERRERDSILAATLAVSASSSSLLPLGGPGSGEGGGGGSNSMCPSPSANSECSSNGRLSSTGSDPGSSLLHNNNNNNCSSKLSDILRSNHTTHLHSQYGVDDVHANRMSLMAAAAAGIVSQSNGNAGVSGGIVSSVDSTSAGAAVQAAVVNLAAAMRMNQQVNSAGAVTSTVAGAGSGNGNLSTNAQQATTSGPVISSSSSALSNVDTAATAVAAMNAMRVTMAADSMMRSNMGSDPITHQNTQHHQHQQHHQQNSPEAALRMQQAEALLRSQAEVAIRLAVSVAASSNNGSTNNDLTSNVRINNGPSLAFGGSTTVPPIPPSNSDSANNNTGNPHSQQQHPPESHTPSSSSNISQQQLQSSHQHPQQQPQQQLQSQQQQQQQPQVSNDISEAIRLQEHRLEQALRLHSDVRALNFLTTTSSNGVTVAENSVSHQQQQPPQQQQQTQQPLQQSQQHQQQHHHQLQQHQQQQHNNNP